MKQELQQLWKEPLSLAEHQVLCTAFSAASVTELWDRLEHRVTGSKRNRCGQKSYRIGSYWITWITNFLKFFLDLLLSTLFPPKTKGCTWKRKHSFLYLFILQFQEAGSSKPPFSRCDWVILVSSRQGLQCLPRMAMATWPIAPVSNSGPLRVAGWGIEMPVFRHGGVGSR